MVPVTTNQKISIGGLGCELIAIQVPFAKIGSMVIMVVKHMGNGFHVWI
jgi:hypothetical protein